MILLRGDLRLPFMPHRRAGPDELRVWTHMKRHSAFSRSRVDCLEPLLERDFYSRLVTLWVVRSFYFLNGIILKSLI